MLGTERYCGEEGSNERQTVCTDFSCAWLPRRSSLGIGPTQAQFYDCANLDGLLRDGTPLLEAERIFYDANCQEEEEEEFDWESIPTEVVRDPSDSCYELPNHVAVFGNVYGTECRMLGEASIMRWELLDRGVIEAVDVWSYVNGGMEVCFRETGWLVFLDAAYAPRMPVEMETFERDGMTCGAINGAGTVVLLASGPSPDPSAEPLPDPIAEPLPDPAGQTTTPTAAHF